MLGVAAARGLPPLELRDFGLQRVPLRLQVVHLGKLDVEPTQLSFMILDRCLERSDLSFIRLRLLPKRLDLVPPFGMGAPAVVQLAVVPCCRPNAPTSRHACALLDLAPAVVRLVP